MTRYWWLAGLIGAAPAFAGGLPGSDIEEIVVTAERRGLLGVAVSATQGMVTQQQLDNRPVSRPGELLEFVPGLIVTQHSGSGKANQYFLRGFNLDHGTDFATRIEGMPVNMRSHAHGQGYTDVNFLIPELIGRIDYRKGPHYAKVGDFSAAGSADLSYRNDLEGALMKIGVEQNGDYRGLYAGSLESAGGTLLLGVDYSNRDGPWVLPEDARTVKALARFQLGDSIDGLTMSAMAYDASWTSTDQVPLRAVQSGLVDRFGFIDPTLGGNSDRYSLSFDLRRPTSDGHWNVSGYAIDYGLNLYSNFTYFLDDPVNGDQFEQFDSRRIYGVEGHYHLPLMIGTESGLEAGIQIRRDDIDTVGLFRTVERRRLATLRSDAVKETSYAAWAELDLGLTPWLRSVIGVRADRYLFNVNSNIAANSGSASKTLASPKLSLVFGPFSETEIFINAGRGFHSNDARGTTIRVDPTDGVTPLQPVDPLATADALDVGVRTAPLPGLQLTADLWWLELDSELVFVGDAGTTETSGASRRRGVELGIFYAVRDSLLIDVDVSLSHARFENGDRIPNAVDNTASLGLTWNPEGPWRAGARLRHLGDAPLDESGSLRSASTTLLNAEIGFLITPNLELSLAAFNLFDADDNDITYFFESQLAGEAAPVADIHFHPVEPQTLLLELEFRQHAHR
ncbi:MAG: TonB-dependent receptor [Woeseia sp.]